MAASMTAMTLIHFDRNNSFKTILRRRSNHNLQTFGTCTQSEQTKCSGTTDRTLTHNEPCVQAERTVRTRRTDRADKLSGPSAHSLRIKETGSQFLDFLLPFCGERGIRTPGASQHGGFQDRCNRPLYHLSSARIASKRVQR